MSTDTKAKFTCSNCQTSKSKSPKPKASEIITKLGSSIEKILRNLLNLYLYEFKNWWFCVDI